MPETEWIIIRFLWTVNVLACALVLWRLYTLGLHKRYRFFFLAFLVKVARSAVLLPFGPRMPIYLKIWIVTEPMLWVSYALVVYELYTLVLKHYQGIYSLSRWFFFAAVATSSIVSMLTVLPTMSGALTLNPVLHHYALLERALFTSLAIFLFLLLALVAWFPVPLSRNLLTHAYLYSAYFLTGNVLTLYWHVGGKDNSKNYDILQLSISILCFASWAFFLSRSGEERITSLRLGRNDDQERRLLHQLESFNSTLLRSARK
jgi:hypothetical protein